jgi:hypothetical protein
MKVCSPRQCGNPDKVRPRARTGPLRVQAALDCAYWNLRVNWINGRYDCVVKSMIFAVCNLCKDPVCPRFEGLTQMEDKTDSAQRASLAGVPFKAIRGAPGIP